MARGEKIVKQDFRIGCATCRRSPEPGWLQICKDDWVQCPSCAGKGDVECLETRVMPTRRIFLP